MTAPRAHRAVFDFRLTFTNGGDLSGTGFLLDVTHERGSELPPARFAFHAEPPALDQLGTFPVRAYAVVG